jgi:CheY-like chemotaxis protein
MGTHIMHEVAPWVPRVLLAEDDPEFRAVLADSLREDGNEVTEVNDGTALLDRLAEASASERSEDAYDMVVTDVRMPGHDAFEVMLGTRRSMPDIPFVLVTAFGDANTHRRAKRLGAVAVLDKPIDLDELRAVVNALSRRTP